MAKKREKESVFEQFKWYHWLVWILGFVALALLGYGIVRNLFF
jgi:hypothetical protein